MTPHSPLAARCLTLVATLLLWGSACAPAPRTTPVIRQSWDLVAQDLKGGVRFHFYGIPPGSEVPLRAVIRFSYSGRTYLTDSEQFHKMLTRRTRQDTSATIARRDSPWFEVDEDSPIDVEIMVLTPENDTAAVAAIRTLVKPDHLTSVSVAVERETFPIDRIYRCRHCHGWQVLPISARAATGPSDSLFVTWGISARGRPVPPPPSCAAPPCQ